MAIPFSIYKNIHTIVSKGLKFLGDNCTPIIIGMITGAIAITGKLTYDKLEEENTKYKYRDWIIYRKGKYVYATRGRESIVKETSEFEDLQKMIDSVY